MPIDVRVKAVLVITGLALLLAAAPAQAATRYASPSGTGAYPCTDNSSEAAMCPVDIAVNGASGSDDVVLANGTYATNFQMLIQPGVTVHGTPGSPPTIIGNATNAGLGEIRLSSGSTLRDVRVEVGDGPTFSTAVVNWSGHMERVYAYTPGLFNNEGCTVAQLGGVVPTVTDSVCVTDSIGHYGLRAGTLGQSGTVALRNVTAVGRGGAAAGIQALSNGDTLTVNASNVIADGPTNDVEARNDASGDKTLHPVTVNLDHSNYATVSFPGGTVGVSATTAGSGTNVTQAPVFRDAPNGDFRQASTSAGTIDRGTAGALSGGELDLEGGARNQGTAPDIGADEISVSSAPTVTAPVVAGSTSVSGTTSEDDGTIILIRVNNVEQASSGISSGGAWTVNSLPAIQAGDSVKASATAPVKTTSAFSTPVVAVLRTTTPVISAPVIAGATSVSGTSAEDGSSIQLFVDGLAAGTNPVVAGGTWSVTGLAPFTAGQVLKANAAKSGEATSFDSDAVTVQAPQQQQTGTPAAPPAGTHKTCKKGSKLKHGKCVRKKKQK
jgi:hypothetical protein